MANDKDVTKTDSREMLPSFLGDSSGDTGFENIPNDCVSIPFLRLAQTNTPQASPGKDKVMGLEPGKYFNPNTGRIYPESNFIILGFFRSYQVWNGEPPDATYVKTLSPEDFSANYEAETSRNDKNKTVDLQGNRYVDTRNFLLMSADFPEDGILLYSMSSTGIPASKKWLAKASAVRARNKEGKLVQAAMWSRIWNLHVSYLEKAKGAYFQVTDIEDRGWIPADLAPIAEAAFKEAQEYDKAKIQVVAKESEEETPEWAK